MKTVVFIDGENFRHRLAQTLINAKKIAHSQALKKFDIQGLVKAILPEETNFEIRYYGAKVKVTGGTSAMRAKTKAIIQQKRAWNSNLKQQGIKYIEAGNLRVRPNEIGKGEYLVEKGVDVSVAVDLVYCSLRNGLKHAILLSSDADLLPAVEVLKKVGVKTTYLAHEEFILPSLSQFSSRTRVYTDQQILHFYANANNGGHEK